MAMKINTTKHFLADAVKSLKRNRTISTAAIATVATTLFILGVFFLAILNANKGILQLQSKVEAQIFLNDNITIEEQKQIESKLNSIEGVADVTYESKAEALEKVKESFGEENRALVEGLEKANPFPSSYIVKVTKPEMVSKIKEAVKDMAGIYEIRDAGKLIDKITSITRTIKIVGGALFVILLGVCLFLIGNTIKLTVYSRRREIGIMKFIGATDWFIRWPFVFEGMIIGLIGAIVAIVLLYYGYNYAYTKLPMEVIFIKLISPSYVLTYVSWEFILLGMFIGSLGSIWAIRKFLAV